MPSWLVFAVAILGASFATATLGHWDYAMVWIASSGITLLARAAIQ